jgi:hypothetical protein
MNAHQSELQTLDRLAWKVHSRKTNTTKTEAAAAIEQLTEVLRELRDLLHDYAPAWYSEEQNSRLESAIQSVSER